MKCAKDLVDRAAIILDSTDKVEEMRNAKATLKVGWDKMKELEILIDKVI